MWMFLYISWLCDVGRNDFALGMKWKKNFDKQEIKETQEYWNNNDIYLFIVTCVMVERVISLPLFLCQKQLSVTLF